MPKPDLYSDFTIVWQFESQTGLYILLYIKVRQHEVVLPGMMNDENMTIHSLGWTPKNGALFQNELRPTLCHCSTSVRIHASEAAYTTCNEQRKYDRGATCLWLWLW
jgi:hypothetical protein